MIKCPYCGKAFSEPETDVCPFCKKELPKCDEDKAMPLPAQPAVQESKEAPPKEPVDPQTKKRRMIGAIVAVAAVVVILLAVAIGSRQGNQPVSTESGMTTEDGSTIGTSKDAVLSANSEPIAGADDDGQSTPASSGTIAAGQSAPAASGEAVSSGAVSAPNVTASAGDNASSGGSSSGGNISSGNQQEPSAGQAAQPQENPFTRTVNIINSGNYSMAGDMVTGSDSMPVSMTYCGDMIRMGVNVDGMAMDMASVDGTFYMINDEAKTYTTLSQSFMEMMDLDPADLDMSQMKWTLDAPQTAKKSQAELNGKTVDCYTIGANTGQLRIYMTGEVLLQIDVLDDAGKTSASYHITAFRGGITEKDILPADDYESQNFMSFFMALLPEE